MAFSVVCSIDRVCKRVCRGNAMSERVVAVCRRIAKRVYRRSDTAKRIINGSRRVTASVGLRDFALECVVGECCRDAGLRGGGANEAVGRGRDRGSSRGRVLDPRDVFGSDSVAEQAVSRRVAALIDGDRFRSEAVGTKTRYARTTDARQARFCGIVVVDRPLSRLAPERIVDGDIARGVGRNQVGASPVDGAVEVAVVNGGNAGVEFVVEKQFEV